VKKKDAIRGEDLERMAGKKSGARACMQEAGSQNEGRLERKGTARGKEGDKGITFKGGSSYRKWGRRIKRASKEGSAAFTPRGLGKEKTMSRRDINVLRSGKNPWARDPETVRKDPLLRAKKGGGTRGGGGRGGED